MGERNCITRLRNNNVTTGAPGDPMMIELQMRKDCYRLQMT